MRRMLFGVLTLMLATAVLSHPVAANAAVVSEETARRIDECIDCQDLGESGHPEFPYVIYVGEYYCEDGAGPNGPCSTCEGEGCNEGEYLAEGPCGNDCMAQHLEQHALLQAAVSAANEQNVVRVLNEFPAAFGLDETHQQLMFIGCGGSVIGAMALDSKLWKLAASTLSLPK